MPKSPQAKRAEQNKILLVIIVAVVAFSVGFIIARTKYKSQLKTTYDMVINQQAQISGQNAQIKHLENNVKTTTPNY